MFDSPRIMSSSEANLAPDLVYSAALSTKRRGALETGNLHLSSSRELTRSGAGALVHSF